MQLFYLKNNISIELQESFVALFKRTVSLSYLWQINHFIFPSFNPYLHGGKGDKHISHMWFGTNRTIGKKCRADVP